MRGKFKTIFLAVALLPAVVLVARRGDEAPAPPDRALAALLATPLTPRHEPTPAPSPDSGCVRLRIGHIGGPLGRVFNDVNDTHLAVASQSGIAPIGSDREAWENGRGLVQLSSTPTYYLDSLTHSFPYLTREAALLLDDIGRRFADSLRARGGGDYRFKVTSVLRTEATIGRLRRVNRNASGHSAHCHATTFDISYAKFVCDNPAGVRRTHEDLKNLLAEILADLRRQNRCLVKHERRQGCFHITAKPYFLQSAEETDDPNAPTRP